MDFVHFFVTNKKKISLLILVFASVLVVICFMYEQGIDHADPEIIDGGNLGEPVQVDERIRIIKDNKTEEKTAFVEDGEITHKEDDILLRNGDFLIHNLDDEKYVIEFVNYDKRGTLYQNQIYKITITTPGTYQYILRTNDTKIEDEFEVK